MRKMHPSEFDGFEKKPEAEWTARDRKLLEVYGVIPLTEAGEKAFREHVRKSPELIEFQRKLAEGRRETPDFGQQTAEGNGGEE